MLTFNIQPYYTAYRWYANTKQLWLPPDTKQLYEENLKKSDTRQLLEKYKWIDAPIEYSFNSYGFRSPEFDYSSAIMFLGCSFTLGIGLPLSQTFSQIVADNLSLANYNISQCGVTPDGAFKFGYCWIKKLRPKIVVYSTHDLSGLEVYKNNKRLQVILRKSKDDILTKFYNDIWRTSSINFELNSIKNIMALRYICESLNIKFIHFDLHSYITNKQVVPIIDYGRELGHPGTETNKRIAEYVLQQIDNIL